MRVVGILSIILGLLSLCSYTKAEEDLYFEGSGDETTSFPTDDEDIEEASGMDQDEPAATAAWDVSVGPTTVMYHLSSDVYSEANEDRFQEEAELYTKANPALMRNISVPPLKSVIGRGSLPSEADHLSTATPYKEYAVTSPPHQIALGPSSDQSLMNHTTSHISYATDVVVPSLEEDDDIDIGFDFGNGRDQGDATIDSIDGVDEEPEVGGGKIRVIQPEENDERIEEPEDEKDDNFDLDKAEIDDNDDIIQDSIMAGNTHFLAAVIVGGCIGLLFAVCVIMLLVYRMRKKDEGSYALEYGLDGKKPQGSYEYTKGVDSKEYYA